MNPVNELVGLRVGEARLAFDDGVDRPQVAAERGLSLDRVAERVT